MNEGQIQFQGTFQDMAILEQELYSKLQDDVMAAATESDSDVVSGVESASEERNKLKKQVSRMKRGETSPGGFVELSSVNKPLSAFEGTTEKRIPLLFLSFLPAICSHYS